MLSMAVIFVFVVISLKLISLITSKGIVDDYLRSLDPYNLGEQRCKVRFPQNVVFPKMGSEGVLDFLNSNVEFFDERYESSYYPIDFTNGFTDKKFKKLVNGEEFTIKWEDLTESSYYHRNDINLMDQYVAIRFINKDVQSVPLYAIAFRRHKHRWGKVVKGGTLDIVLLGSFEQISQASKNLQKDGNI